MSFICCSFLLFTSCKEQKAVVTGLSFKITADSNWGLIGTDGTLLAMNAFEYQPSAVVNNRFGVQDAEGQWQLYDISQPQSPLSSKKYLQLGYFFEKVTIAQEEENAPLLIIDTQGEIVSRIDTYNTHPLVMAHNFSDGLALVCTDQLKYGYVNTQGEMVIKPVYDLAYDFFEGLAVVGQADDDGRMALVVINKEGKVQYYINLQHSRITGHYSDGKLGYKDMKWGYCGFLDKQGMSVLRLSDQITETMAYVHGAAICFTANGAGLINSLGQLTIPGHYDVGKVVGADRVAFRWRGKWALFDFSGKPLSEFAYDEIGDFHNGNFTFVCQSGSYQLMNREGTLVGSNCYAVVVSDAVAERKMPQLFLRHPADTAKEETGITTEGNILPPASNVPSTASTGSSASVSVALTRKDVIRKISSTHPFYEESRKLLSVNLPEEDVANRRLILDYMEHFRTAYTTKDIDFLEQLFSEEALIIVGKVVKKARNNEQNLLSSEQVMYNIRSKREYLSRLKRVFDTNRQIAVHLEDFHIRKHPTRDGIYGVSMKQGYTSDLYSDEGHLFLLWDFRDKQAPLIHVRTWQPAMLNAGTPLPAEEIFNLGSFSLE